MELETLTREDALWLLSQVPVGRVVYTVGALPAVTPVNFILDGESIVLRTAPDSRLASSVRDAIVAFEVDDIDTASHTGWTVTIIGHASHVDDSAEIHRLTAKVHPWANTHPRDLLIRIDADMVSGRRLVSHASGDTRLLFSG